MRVGAKLGDVSDTSAPDRGLPHHTSGGTPGGNGGDEPPAAGPGSSEPLAPLRRRFGALLVDWILCVFAAGLIGPARTYPWAPSVVLVFEYAFFVGLFGQTPGMFITRIRCVAAEGGGVLGIPRALLRGFLLTLVVPPLIMDSYQRGLHDRAAGSVVVSTAPAARKG